MQIMIDWETFRKECKRLGKSEDYSLGIWNDLFIEFGVDMRTTVLVGSALLITASELEKALYD